MSASIVLTCDAPIGEHGVCPAQTRTRAETVAYARALVTVRGWWHDTAVGDRCPDHGPKRRTP